MKRMIHERLIPLNEETFKDMIAAYLYATTFVEYNEEVLEVHIGEVREDGMRMISYKTITNKEAELIVHS